MDGVTATVLKKDASESASKIAPWRNFNRKLERVHSQLKHDRTLAFSFIEGALIRAVRQGMRFFNDLSILSLSDRVISYRIMMFQVIGSFWTR